MLTKFKIAAAAVLAASAAFGAGTQRAEAGTEYSFNVGTNVAGDSQNISVTADSNFTGTNFTGTLSFEGGDVVSVLRDITSLTQGTDWDFNAGGGFVNPGSYLTFDNGTVVDGRFELADGFGQTLTIDVPSHIGVIDNGVPLGVISGSQGAGWTVTGLTVNAIFSDPSFLGINDPHFDPNKAYSGTFTSLTLQMAQGSTTGNGHMNLTVVVPNPAVAMGALPLLGIIGAGYVRRRRQA